MTKFYDNNRVLDITMRAESGEDFSSDFFEDAVNRKNYNPATDPVDLETEAASLYDGGWRAKDRDAIQKEYDLTDDDTDAIVEKLAEYENR